MRTAIALCAALIASEALACRAPPQSPSLGDLHGRYSGIGMLAEVRAIHGKAKGYPIREGDVRVEFVVSEIVRGKFESKSLTVLYEGCVQPPLPQDVGKVVPLIVVKDSNGTYYAGSWSN